MKKAILSISVLLIALASCTENSRARSWGGTETIRLKKNEIITNMTWKESNLWIQTVDTTTGVTYFREKSSWGYMEGEIIVKPKR